MQIKELVREQILTEIISERDGMILDMNENAGQKDKEIEALKQEIEKLKTANVKLSEKKT